MLHGPRIRVLQAAVILLVASPVAADWLALGDGRVGDGVDVRIERDGETSVRLRVDVAGLLLETRAQGGVVGTAVTIPGCVALIEDGAPELPLLARAVPLPARGEPRLTVETAHWRRVAAAAPLPSPGALTRDQARPETAPRTFGPVYAADEVWPVAAAELGRPFLVRDRRGVAVRIHPVRWDAARGELLVLETMTLRVDTAGGGGTNVAEQTAAAAPRAFAPILTTLFGEAAVPDKAAAGEPGRMLMITTEPLAAGLQPLAQWKRDLGHEVEIVTMSALGGSAAAVQAALAVRYSAPEGLAHALLIGDTAQVPTNTGWVQGADSDGIYGLLAGDDLFVDVLVSRLPARTPAELAVMVERTIAYERDVPAGAGWCATGAGIASDEGIPADWERAEALRDGLLAGPLTDVARIYQGLGGTGAQIAEAVDAGLGMINYIGHGSGTGWLSVPFTSADVHALDNTAAWPWILDVSCSNGDFSAPECFAEAWLRANVDGAPTGAVAMISASTATSWVPPCVMQETMLDRLLGGTVELGALLAAGVAEVLVQYDGTIEGRKLMEQYNVFGDGSLRVRSRPPRALAVSHAPQLDPAASVLTVGGPEGASAVLRSGTAVVARGTIGASGEVDLVVGAMPPAGTTVQLTVAAADAATYRTALPVSDAPVGTEPEEPPSVLTAGLQGNWPNPFNPATTVGFALPQAGPVRLTVHDPRGRLVRVLVDGARDAGTHTVVWDGRDAGGRPVASGIYLARLQGVDGQDVRKLTLAR
jgi:hypothetical protein